MNHRTGQVLNENFWWLTNHQKFSLVKKLRIIETVSTDLWSLTVTKAKALSSDVCQLRFERSSDGVRWKDTCV